MQRKLLPIANKVSVDRFSKSNTERITKKLAAGMNNPPQSVPFSFDPVPARTNIYRINNTGIRFRGSSLV